MICSKPANEIISGVACPMTKGTVCMTHCYAGCKSLDTSCSLAKCTYKKDWRGGNKKNSSR